MNNYWKYSSTGIYIKLLKIFLQPFSVVVRRNRFQCGSNMLKIQHLQ